MAEVAFAAGFASIRTFNDTVREVFALSPSELRTRVAEEPASHATSTGAPGVIGLRLPFRVPLNPDNLFGHLAATAVPGVEEWRDGAYRRTLRLPYGHGIVALAPTADHIACRLSLTDPRDLDRRHQPLPPDARPGRRPGRRRRTAAYGPAAGAARRQGAGRRVPRTVDAAEFAVRAVLGQQVSTAAARTHAARLVDRARRGGRRPRGRAHPSLPVGRGARRPSTPRPSRCRATRRTTLTTLVAPWPTARSDLGVDSDWAESRARLIALPGFGPWTVEVIAMRAFGDPDAFLPTDLGVRRAAQESGPAVHPGRAHRACRGLAALARVRRPVPVGDRRHPINFLPA